MKNSKNIAAAAFAALVICLMSASAVFAQHGRASRPSVSTTIVINEIYGGAGCGNPNCSTYKNDYIELKNISGLPVDISGWSVQYASATGSSWTSKTDIPTPTILLAGDTYLIAEAFGTNGINDLPTPNLTGTIALKADAGKVALVNNTTALTGTCPTGSQIIDLVGYGATASCYETARAPAPSMTNSISRNASGTDTDDNSVDFTAGTPSPMAAQYPTAAEASVSGRVVTANGNGIRNVLISITGGNTPQRLIARTGSFGYYRIDGLEAGNTYVITIQSKNYTFAEPSRVITVNDSLTDIDFTALP